MHKYFIKVPRLVKKLFPRYIWDIPSEDKVVYFTFDDGPHPQITPWVLETLEKYNAKASFFCIGQNAEKHISLYNEIIAAGHAIGNHTYSHLDGWKVSTKEYIDDIKKASKIIPGNLFRPPYGRLKGKHLEFLDAALNTNAKVIMWDVLSADFDLKCTPQQCLKNVLDNVRAGSIVVFHDSSKAHKNLMHTLPAALQLLSEKGCLLKKIEIV